MLSPAAMQVLRLTHEVVEKGGDSHHCRIGQYCLRCCVAIAKTQYDRELDASAIEEEDCDLPLNDARCAIARQDGGISHTRDSALALIEKVMIECSTSVE